MQNKSSQSAKKCPTGRWTGNKLFLKGGPMQASCIQTWIFYLYAVSWWSSWFVNVITPLVLPHGAGLSGSS